MTIRRHVIFLYSDRLNLSILRPSTFPSYFLRTTCWKKETFKNIRTIWRYYALPFSLYGNGVLYGTLQWRHNERDGVWNNRRLDCLLSHLLRPRSKKTSKVRVTGLCEGNPPMTDEFPSQRVSNAENVSIWWRYHEYLPHWSLVGVMELDGTKFLTEPMFTSQQSPQTFTITWEGSQISIHEMKITHLTLQPRLPITKELIIRFITYMIIPVNTRYVTYAMHIALDLC